MSSNGIARSHDSSIFSFLRTLHMVLLNGSISLKSHQQCRKVPFSLYPLQDLLFVEFFVCVCDDGHSDWCEMIPHCSFDLHFTNNGDAENLLTICF